MFVGDLVDANAGDDDKPVNSVELAKFLSKAAKVTTVLFHVGFVLRVTLSDVLLLLQPIG